MEIYNQYSNIADNDKSSVVAIGNFDGLHRGHQILIGKAREIALELGTKLSVMSFTPHPRLVFQSHKDPFLLTNEEQKKNLLDKLCQVNTFFNIPFTKDFAALPAQSFIDDVLINGLNARHIVIGHDFCFGKMRQGNAETLSNQKDFDTTIIHPLSDINGTIFSSSEIRNALRRGDIEKANELLGWEWHIEGKVIHGDKRGRELGYPTANMNLNNYLCPAKGIYATLVKIDGETKWHEAVTNIGIRPMFKSKEPLVETFIFDFDGDLYGKTLKIKPIKFIRGEAKFDSLDALVEQMSHDCQEARKIIHSIS